MTAVVAMAKYKDRIVLVKNENNGLQPNMFNVQEAWYVAKKSKVDLQEELMFNLAKGFINMKFNKVEYGNDYMEMIRSSSTMH